MGPGALCVTTVSLLPGYRGKRSPNYGNLVPSATMKIFRKICALLKEKNMTLYLEEHLQKQIDMIPISAMCDTIPSLEAPSMSPIPTMPTKPLIEPWGASIPIQREFSHGRYLTSPYKFLHEDNGSFVRRGCDPATKRVHAFSNGAWWVVIHPDAALTIASLDRQFSDGMYVRKETPLLSDAVFADASNWHK